MDSILSSLSHIVTKSIMAVATVGLLVLPLEVNASHPIVPAASATTPIIQGFAVTPEGWWLIFTNSQQEVASMCGEPVNNQVIGCARWPDTEDGKEVFPAKHCLVMILVSDPEEHVAAILEHELLHCKIGSFHK